MLTRLLESKANHNRSVSGAVASVVAHSGLIGLAIYATAQAGLTAQPSAHVVGPVYLLPRAPARLQPARGSFANALSRRLVFVNPTVNIALPSVDIPLATIGAGDFKRDPVAGPALFGGGSTVPNGTYATFRADQVEKQVSLIPGSPSPAYPDELRIVGKEGRVVAQFVVDEEGRVEEKTVKFVRSDNVLFDEAVRSALPGMRFAPAEIAGRKVRQLVEMPFVFALSR